MTFEENFHKETDWTDYDPANLDSYRFIISNFE